MKSYDVHITTEEPVPDDVMIEHIAVALRDFNFAGKVDVQMARNHPFEGPEVFDDYKPASATDVGVQELLEDMGVEDPFLLTTQVIDRLKGTRRHGND